MKIKALFHIDESEKWKLLIKNVKNLYKVLDDAPFEIEVLANSVAVTEYRKECSVFAEEFREFSAIGIKLCACRNALNEQKISPEELFEFVKIVPVGVKEIIEKQYAGYAYLKP